MILVCIKQVSPYCQKRSTQQPYKSSFKRNWICPACATFISKLVRTETRLVNDEADSLFDYLKRYQTFNRGD